MSENTYPEGLTPQVAKDEQTRLFWYKWTCKADYGSGYDKTYIRIFVSRGTNLDYLIAQCTGNKSGYQTQEIADNVGSKFTTLRDMGYTHTCDFTWSESSITLDWLHYTPEDASEWKGEYCRPNCDVGDSYPQLIQNTKLLQKVVKRAAKCQERDHVGVWCIDNPNVVVDALMSFGGRKAPQQKIDAHKVGDAMFTEYVYKAA